MTSIGRTARQQFGRYLKPPDGRALRHARWRRAHTPMLRGFGLAQAGLVGAAAGLTYLFDPQQGRQRRAKLRDRLASKRRRAAVGAERVGRDLQNRTRGLVAEARALRNREPVSDDVLHARVCSEIGRVLSTPRHVECSVREGRVTVRGSVPASEYGRLLSTVARLRGVVAVQDEITPTDPEPPRGRRPPARLNILQSNWAPATRALAGSAGAALALFGVRRAGWLGAGMLGSGVTLLLRALTNREVKELAGLASGQVPVEVQKFINIRAPIEEVYAFFSNFENFPRFMEHVREVKRLDGRRSRWTVHGPAGVPISWEAETTGEEPPRRLTWKSAGTNIVAHCGAIELRTLDNGETQVSIHISYKPPAGVIGHGLAMLFGADPKHQMNRDLLRVKTLLEGGATTVEGEAVRKG